MPKRANSFVRKMEILQFTLLASEGVTRGRNSFFAINSHMFEKEWEWKIDYSQEEEIDIRTRKEKPPGRKIFRTYIQELLDEKLLVRIHTNDDRANWYSITPLGICQLIKSEEFFDGLKLRWPENYFVVLVLMTFAIQNVKQYKSIILEKEKFINSKTDFWGDLTKTPMSIREELPDVLSNIDIEKNKFSLYITNGYYQENKLPLARGSFNHDRIDDNGKVIQQNLIQVIELNKKIGIRKDPDYEPLLLDDEQFHQYFANLLIGALVYDYTIAEFDIARGFHFRHPKRGKIPLKSAQKDFSEIWKKYPEYFQRISSLFAKHASKIVNEQTNLMNDFKLIESKI